MARVESYSPKKKLFKEKLLKVKKLLQNNNPDWTNLVWERPSKGKKYILESEPEEDFKSI